MAVPYTFGSATTSIPLSQLDSNFATTITLGNTAIQLGNTVTTLNNMTLASPTLTTPALGTPASGVMTNVTSIPAAQITGSQAIPKSTLPTGSVLQVVSATTQTATTTTGAITDTALTATITPTSATSKILIMIQGRAYNSTQGTENNWYIYRGASAIFNGRTIYSQSGGGIAAYQTLNYLDSPATTSATTYKLSISTSGGTFYFMVDGATAGTAAIILLEIAG
jgi:hypothetical protein